MTSSNLKFEMTALYQDIEDDLHSIIYLLEDELHDQICPRINDGPYFVDGWMDDVSRFLEFEA